MKNKAFLPLMEQLIMILVFALTAVLCLKGFTLANHASHRQENRNHAALKVQNAAELLKASSGDFTETAIQLQGILTDTFIVVSYDSRWEPVSSQNDSDFLLKITPAETDSPLLGAAHIALYEASAPEIHDKMQPLFEIHTAWQLPVTGGDGV